MIMSSPVKERVVIDIRATVESHSDIADDRLAIYGLWCRCSGFIAWHRHTTVVKVAKKGVSHSSALLTRSQTEGESENTIEDPDDNAM